MNRPASLTVAAPSGAERRLRKELDARGFEFGPADHAHWRARGEGLTVTAFRSGKLLIQGKADLEEFAASLSLEHSAGDIHKGRRPEAWIGSDEAGKGDFFGPLAVAAVRMDGKALETLKVLGVRDSKTLSDNRIFELAETIRKVCLHSVVAIGPEKYNEIYPGFGSNLNRLLAWAHVRAISTVVERGSCGVAVVDKFAPERVVEEAARKEGLTLKIRQEVRAERDEAVAAASVLAREAFVRGLERLEKEHGVKLGKGCSKDIEMRARVLGREKGAGFLGKVAKMHFRTAQAALEGL